MKRIIKKFRIDKRIRVGYGSAFFLLLISYLFTLYANSQLQEQAKRVDQTNQMITQLETLGSQVKGAIAAFRGYVIMRDKSFLRPFYESAEKIPVTIRRLEIQTKDNRSQLTSLIQTKDLIEKRFSEMNRCIQEYPNGDLQVPDSLRMIVNSGKIAMESLGTLLKGMEIQEKYFLARRTEELSARYSSMNAIKTVSLILAFSLLAFGFITYVTENKARRKADVQVAMYQEELEKRIDELDKANKELIQMRSLEKFTSTGRIARTIAHEVRNPLTNINLAVDQLRPELNGLDKSNAMILDLIVRNGERINHLITQLLDSTKFAELKYERVSVNTVLDEALDLARDRIALKKVKVVKEYASDLCEVFVDKEKIRIAFLNIIVNAIEAVEPGKGILELHSRAKDGKCIVEVRDNGFGMDDETMSRLFEPYFTSKSRGTGLGLTNTQNIILNHKGNISVESKPGKGTAFFITLDFSN